MDDQILLVSGTGSVRNLVLLLGYINLGGALVRLKSSWIHTWLRRRMADDVIMLIRLCDYCIVAV